MFSSSCITKRSPKQINMLYIVSDCTSAYIYCFTFETITLRKARSSRIREDVNPLHFGATRRAPQPLH